MKKSILALGAIAALGLAAVGCGDEDPCENYTCDKGKVCVDVFGLAVCQATEELCEQQGMDYKDGQCVNKEAEVECKADTQCDTANGFVCDTSIGKCIKDSTPEVAKYTYVRIDDLADLKKTGMDPGADIDAIVVTKQSSGQHFYAADIMAYARGGGEGACTSKEQCKRVERTQNAFDPSAILYEPDSLVDYADADTKKARVCNYYKTVPTEADPNGEFTFVSLGGKGGYIIVEIGGIAAEGGIQTGDTIDVLELGDCDVPGATTKDGDDFTISKDKDKAEPIKVSIAVSDDAEEGDWVVVVETKQATNGVITGNVTLPN